MPTTNSANRWRYGRMTVEWPICVFGWWRAVGMIRVHDDETKIPGDYHCVGTIIVKRGRYEIVGFITKAERPSGAEFRALYKHLASLGLKKHQHVRAKGGRVHVIPGSK